MIKIKEFNKAINEDCTFKSGMGTIQNMIEFDSSEEEFKLLLMSFNNFNSIS